MEWTHISQEWIETENILFQSNDVNVPNCIVGFGWFCEMEVVEG